ncbi:Dimodular nonribosomal peptide synthase [Mycobacterium marinum]|nr:Dimodular nonribosomal peptide synthase [Mycobacterium marinum]
MLTDTTPTAVLTTTELTTHHHNATTLTTTLTPQLGPTTNQVWSQCHSYAFDYSVWEIFGALLGGGRLVVVPEHVVTSPEELHQLLINEQVTVLSQTPAAFYALQAVHTTLAEQGQKLAVKTVVLGGEAFTPARAGAWLSQQPHTRLINMYGITETTVHATLRDITEHDTTNDTSPIGTPLHHLAFAVLDSSLRTPPTTPAPSAPPCTTWPSPSSTARCARSHPEPWVSCMSPVLGSVSAIGAGAG